MNQDFMNQDLKMDTTDRIVADGERRRRELLVTLSQTSPLERGAVVTGLIMFYRQAFRSVIESLPFPVAPESVPACVLQEAVRGIALYTVWQQAETSLATPPEYERMAEHWRNITLLVLR